jgi:hypothetical protein
MCQQDLLSPEKAATCVAMQSLPSPDVLDWKHDFRKHQAPTDQVVSGNAPVVTNQNRFVSDGAKGKTPFIVEGKV